MANSKSPAKTAARTSPAKKSPAKTSAATKKPAKKTAAKKAVAKAGAKETPQSMPAAGKDPSGGLTAAGRKFFNETQGSHLRPGVRGEADTPDKMKRKGSFLTRHFTHPRGPMEKDGKPTRLALSAQAWGESLPKTEAQAKKLAAKGRQLLEKFHAEKEKQDAGRKSKAPAKAKSPAKKVARKALKKTPTR